MPGAWSARQPELEGTITPRLDPSARRPSPGSRARAANQPAGRQPPDRLHAWREAEPLPGARQGCAAIAHEGGVAVVGGGGPPLVLRDGAWTALAGGQSGEMARLLQLLDDVREPALGSVFLG